MTGSLSPNGLVSARRAVRYASVVSSRKPLPIACQSPIDHGAADVSDPNEALRHQSPAVRDLRATIADGALTDRDAADYLARN